MRLCSSGLEVESNAGWSHHAGGAESSLTRMRSSCRARCAWSWCLRSSSSRKVMLHTWRNCQSYRRPGQSLCQGKLWTESYRNISSRKAHELFTFHEGRRPELPVIIALQGDELRIDRPGTCMHRLATDELPQSLLSASPLVALDGVLLGSARVKVGRGRQPSWEQRGSSHQLESGQRLGKSHST